MLLCVSFDHLRYSLSNETSPPKLLMWMSQNQVLHSFCETVNRRKVKSVKSYLTCVRIEWYNALRISSSDLWRQILQMHSSSSQIVGLSDVAVNI